MNLCRGMQLHQISSSLGGLAGMTGKSRHSRDQRLTAYLFILFIYFSCSDILASNGLWAPGIMQACGSNSYP